MTKIEKTERIQEIKELVQAFCNRHLNEELAGVKSALDSCKVKCFLVPTLLRENA